MSLLTKHLTSERKRTLYDKVSESGWTLEDLIRSGVEIPSSSIGVYAGDADCYHTFSELLAAIIDDYHGQPGPHVDDDPLTPAGLPLLTEPDGPIVSTRVRVARNVTGYPFTANIEAKQRAQLHDAIASALETLPSSLTGSYWPLEKLSTDHRARLNDKHLLFRDYDRFLESAGIRRDWPHHRGIFVSDDHRFSVWVNEEDHLRIISMQPGADLDEVYERLKQGLQHLSKTLAFAKHPSWGFLASCPSNIGTALRASFHIHLPRLAKTPDILQQLASQHNLQIRGTHGEHTEASGSVYDVSNRHRLGVSAAALIRTLHRGAAQIVAAERSCKPSYSEI